MRCAMGQYDMLNGSEASRQSHLWPAFHGSLYRAVFLYANAACGISPGIMLQIGRIDRQNYVLSIEAQSRKNRKKSKGLIKNMASCAARLRRS